MVKPIAQKFGQDYRSMAKDFFNAAKEEVVKNIGDRAYFGDIGDQMIAQISTNQKAKEMIEKRLAAGFNLDDIRIHLNQTSLMHHIQIKIAEMPDFMELHMAMRQGKSMDDLGAISAGWRKTKPRWGITEPWDNALPVNKGFTAEDADLYIEFYIRVSRWMEKTSVTQQSILLEGFNSYNAMLRDQIRKGAI